MTEKLKRFLIPIIVFIMLFAIATVISFTTFNVTNPFAVVNGLYQVTFTDKQYSEIQSYPKVIIANPQLSLESYMKTKGFIENEEQQLGALYVFENGATQQHIITSVNKYFARWHWQE